MSDELYYIIGGGIAGLVFLIIILTTLYVCRRKKDKKMPTEEQQPTTAPDENKVYYDIVPRTVGRVHSEIPDQIITEEERRNEVNIKNEVYYSEIPYVLNERNVRDNTIGETVQEENHYMPLLRNNPSEPVYSEAMKDANNMPVHQVGAVHSDGNEMPVHYTGEECYIEMK